MKCAYHVGLALLMNVAIVSGGILPGTGMPIVALISQKQDSSAQKVLSDGFSLLMSKRDEASFRKAISLFEQALKLSEAEKNIPVQASALSYLGQSYSSLNKEQEALGYYTRSLELYKSIGDRVNAAKMFSWMASSYATLGDKQKALEYYNQALPILIENDKVNIGSEPFTIQTLQSMGSIYIDFGKKQQGLELYVQALNAAQNTGVVGIRSLVVDVLGSLIEVCLKIDEDAKALDYANQALAQLEGIRNPLRKGRIFYQAGLAYARSKDYQQALDYFEKAVSIVPSNKGTEGEAIVLTQMVSAAYGAGKSEKAIEYGTLVLPLLQKAKNRKSESQVLNTLGLAYSGLGDNKKALEYFKQSLPIARAIDDKQLESTLLSNIGLAYAGLGMDQEALKYYEQSLPLRRSAKDKNGEAATRNNVAYVYLRLGDYDAALENFNQSLAISQGLNDRAGEAITLLNSAALYARKDNIPEALKYSNQALSIFRAIGAQGSESVALRSLAAIYLTQNNLAEALQTINPAIQIIESRRSELKNDALKTSYFATVQDAYQLKTDILMKLHQQQPTKGYDAAALENTDQSRARILRELLIQANANIKKDVSPDLLKQEQTLNQTLDAQEKQLVQLSSQPGKEPQLTALKKTIAALYTDRDTLKNTIRATNPAYANLQYPKPITLAQIQQQLEPDTLMLQYSLGEKQSYLWVISNTTLKTYLLPKRSDIETTAKAFRQDITGQADAFDRASIEITPITPSKNPSNQPLLPSSALTQQILAPAAADLGQKRLVIIPDGILNTIPFSALDTPNSASYTPLLTQHEITNLPSASTIAILRTTVATKPRAPKLLAILADPIFNKNDDRLTGQPIQANPNTDLGEQIARQRNGRDLNLARLPFTATEANGILNLVPQESDRISAFGFDASYDWITSPKISQYRYVHLATHGIFDNNNPALSSIILSSFDAQGRDRKAYLRFPDLFNLNLPTELVVLSACQTGLGSDVPGEGLVGMTRGLMYAGALRVSVSLWKVDDQSTSDLMQQFYKNLWQSKISHAASLRQAQLSLWKQGKAPVYWAAVTLQGEWRN